MQHASTWRYTHVYMYMCIYLYIQRDGNAARQHLETYIHMYTCIHTHTHASIHFCIYIHTHSTSAGGTASAI